MADVILSLNAGSSSIKFAIYRIGERGELEIDKQGQLEGMGSRPHLVVEEESGDVILDRTEVGLAGDGTKSLAVVIRRLLEAHHLVAVGHRVVHGGAQFSGPVIVTADAMQQLESLVPLAPLHQPFNLAPIREVAREFPDVPQVACFDTAFHHGHPAVADFFALPRSLHAQGIRRYGFHGLSYEYIMRTLPAAAPDIAGKRVVVAHLGSGASLCATRDFKSVDCTLSFTALGGLPMGTRSGDLDPGVLLYLLQQEQMSVADLEKLLYKDSGLKGVSGVSNDMRDLEIQRRSERRFCRRPFHLPRGVRTCRARVRARRHRRRRLYRRHRRTFQARAGGGPAAQRLARRFP